MKFVLIHGGKLKITLSPKDLEKYDITYESMDYTNRGTKELLVELLDQGRLETGFNPRRAKLYIEVFPAEDGGMVIYFTSLSASRVPQLHPAKTPVPVIFAFEDAEDLIQACSKASTQYGHRIYKSALYRMKSSWRLIVYPLDYADQLSIFFLSEFAPQVGEGAVHAAYIQEHGDEILGEDALEILARHMD